MVVRKSSGVGRSGLLAGGLVSLSLPSTVQAHMLVDGAGDLGNGALHPLMTPAHLLVLISLALLLAQQVPLDLKTPLRFFAPLSAIALAFTATASLSGVPQPLLLGTALGLGILVGLEVKLSHPFRMLACAVPAVAIGLDSGLEIGSGVAITKSLLGTWLAMNGLVLYLTMAASNATGKPWARTGLRVIGSWIIAISLMVLAFSLRK